MRRLAFILLLGLGLTLARPFAAAAAPDDWPRAMELMNAGQSEAALPYLERLVSAHPGDKNYRFELALALFRLGRDFRAKWHLDQVRGAGLTAAEARLVEQFLDKIEARRVWSGSFGFALKPESNASRQTGNTHVNVGGLNFALTPGSRAKPGTSVIAHGGLSYSPRISERMKGVFGLNAYLRHNKDSGLRDYQLTARSGLEYLPTTRSRISGGTFLGYRWIADAPYSYSGGIWASYSALIGTRGRLDLGGETGRTRYEVALPDGRQHQLTASYSHAIGGKTRLGITGFWENTENALGNLAGTRKAVSVSGLYAWDGGLMTSLRLGHLTDKRRGPEPIFGVKRHDRNTSLDLTLYHRDFRIGNFAPELVLGVERNRSNIPLADYRNRYLSFGLTRNF